eukprot:37383-Eustigmatos_ZCMA.PRE.1
MSAFVRANVGRLRLYACLTETVLCTWVDLSLLLRHVGLKTRRVFACAVRREMAMLWCMHKGYVTPAAYEMIETKEKSTLT